MIDISTINFDVHTGLVPAIIQDADSQVVLMQGYMNREAIEKTLSTNKVTFFSRSKNRLWTKGESSKNYLNLFSIKNDCDNDSLLVLANPEGPTCHTGSDTCWGEVNSTNKVNFLNHLTNIIKERRANPYEKSYTAHLFEKGINKIAQKVGEEAVELVIEAKDDNDELFINEASDLMYHYLVLLEAKGFSLDDVCDVLKERHN